MIAAKAAKIRLLLFDVDGVLTDGKILLHADGSESKQFDIKDGTAIVWAQRVGLTVGFLSARTSVATTRRAAQLGITLLHQGVPRKNKKDVAGVVFDQENRFDCFHGRQLCVGCGNLTLVSQKSLMLFTRLSNASNCTGLVR